MNVIDRHRYRSARGQTFYGARQKRAVRKKGRPACKLRHQSDTAGGLQGHNAYDHLQFRQIQFNRNVKQRRGKNGRRYS